MSTYSNRLQPARQNLLQHVVWFLHPRSSCTTTYISEDVQRITVNASYMTISGGRTKLDIFCRLTGFNSDFLSFIVVELIRFFHGAIQMSCNKTTKEYSKPIQSWALFNLGVMEMIPSPQLGFLRGVFLANYLASNENLTRTAKSRTHTNTNKN